MQKLVSRFRLGAPTSMLGLAVLLAACGSETPPPPGASAVAFEVGYSEVEVPWRVGAKPGQVGTDALPARDQLLLRSLGQLLPIVTPPVDPVMHLEGATNFVLDRLEDRVEAVQPGHYNALFEPGHGLEQPPVMKALVLRHGDTKIAIVRADLYLGHEQIHRRVAELVAAQTGLDRDHILFVATHNHSVPHSVSPSPGVWILADAFDPRQFVYVTHAIARAVIEADAAARPAVLRTSVREFRDVQRNIIGPGVAAVLNPDGVPEAVPVGYPHGYFDADLASLRFEDAHSGAPLAFLFVFGMHPESLPGGHGISSGEWPTHVEKKLRERTGVPAIWLPGALGDSEPDNGSNHADHHFWRTSFDTMEAMSEIIATAAQNAFTATGAAAPQAEPRLEQVVTDLPGIEDFPLPTSAYLGPRFPLVRILHDAATVRLHAIRVGDAVFLGSPSEVTTDLSLNIKSRVDRTPGNFYQGYEWPEAPQWVKQRVRSNFTNDEVDPAQGVNIPIVISHADGYMGYIVSAWEYENRTHYREEMTAFGPRTADYVASSFVAMVRQLEGGPAFQLELPPWHNVDVAGIDEIQASLASMDDQVSALSRNLPASDPNLIGNVISEPTAQVELNEHVSFSWLGGTNDMEPPKIAIEKQDGDRWITVTNGPSRDAVLFFAPPDRWTAEWRSAAGSEGDKFRFRIQGIYRGTSANVSAPDPLWDPDGKNVHYVTLSRTFEIGS